MPTTAQALSDLKREIKSLNGRVAKMESAFSQISGTVATLDKEAYADQKVEAYRALHKGSSNGNGKKMSDKLITVIGILTAVIMALVALLK